MTEREDPMRGEANGESRRMAGVRSGVAATLERVGLAQPAYRVLEWARTFRALPEQITEYRRTGPDGLPLPPAALRLKVTHTASAAEFLAQGARAATTVRELVARSGRKLEELSSVFDFGCGCGRVMRHWADVSGPGFYGSDYNSNLVEWCVRNLPFATFRVNSLSPPLPFEDDQFEFVYALSVFTHLTEPLQHMWMSELARVIKPGGLLLFTTRGDAWLFKLSPEERARYDAGQLVTRYGGAEGTNLCAAWHPWSYVHDRLTPSFEMVESVAAALEDGHQDAHLVRRVA